MNIYGLYLYLKNGLYKNADRSNAAELSGDFYIEADDKNIYMCTTLYCRFHIAIIPNTTELVGTSKIEGFNNVINFLNKIITPLDPDKYIPKLYMKPIIELLSNPKPIPEFVLHFLSDTKKYNLTEPLKYEEEKYLIKRRPTYTYAKCCYIGEMRFFINNLEAATQSLDERTTTMATNRIRKCLYVFSKEKGFEAFSIIMANTNPKPISVSSQNSF